MFATGPANNCALEMFTTDAYGSILTNYGMENIRTLELMLDLEILAVDSASDQLLFGESNSFFIDMDCNGPSATPLSGLRAVIKRNSTMSATPADTTPEYARRLTLWVKDDGSTIQFRTNGLSGTDVTYTATEASYPIVTPMTPASPIYIGRGTSLTYLLRLYEAAIRVNGTLVFHVRPRLWMADSATPGTVPDLSGYGNNLTVAGAHGTDYRYVPSWSRQVPYSGKENVG